MPTLESYSSAGTDPRWGQGMEQFGFWHVDDTVKRWQKEFRLPQVLTSEFLIGAPAKAIALLRDISFLKQTDGLKVESPGYPMSTLAEMGLGRVGDVFTEPEDGGRTTNYVIPVESDGSGHVQIVVNPAWGVHWKLSKDHPLAKLYPQLTITHQPDNSAAPASTSGYGYRPYLPPEDLADATGRIVNIPVFARNLRDFTADLLKHKEGEVHFGGWSLGLMHDSHTHSLDIAVNPPHVHTGVSLHLGDEMGIKRVNMYGYFPSDMEGEMADLARKGQELDMQWDLLHRYTSKTGR